MALTATIDGTGISAPDYPSVLAQLQDLYRGIYGSDVYLEPDSQDGAFLALLALAISDVNSVAIGVYNAFSPATAFGEGLSRVVKINGIAREVSSYSSATLTLGGTAGTVVTNGLATDAANNQWVIPGVVIIPASGTVDAQAQATTVGAINAAAGAINVIASPVRGWQTVTNAAPASPGAPVESDGQLRLRQTVSTALPSRTIFEGIVGALLAVPGVTRVRGYENATALTDALGTTAYTLRFVVQGGADQDVANVIAARKTPGVLTQGSTAVTVTNVYGLSQPIRFERLSPITHYLTINITGHGSYTAATGQAILDAVTAYANALPIGQSLQINRVIGIVDAVDPVAFDVTGVLVGISSGSQTTTNFPLLFNQAVNLPQANITLNVA